MIRNKEVIIDNNNDIQSYLTPPHPALPPIGFRRGYRNHPHILPKRTEPLE